LKRELSIEAAACVRRRFFVGADMQVRNQRVNCGTPIFAARATSQIVCKPRHA
jgi:hypothetical protein